MSKSNNQAIKEHQAFVDKAKGIITRLLNTTPNEVRTGNEEISLYYEDWIIHLTGYDEEKT